MLELLPEGQPWKSQEVQHLLNEEFDAEYHPVYLGKFLKKLGLSRAIPRTKRPSRPENAEEILEERVGDAFDEGTDEPHNKQDGDDKEGWVVDDDICTDSGTVLGFWIHPSCSPGTTHSGCTTSMTRTSLDRWFVTMNQQSASTLSTVRAW